MDPQNAPQSTPLLSEHLKLDARMVEYAGWLLPVQYTGITAEHLAVRQAAGLFDVSHMGEIMVSGLGAAPFLNYLLTRDLSRMLPGRAYYSPMCYCTGGTVDDLLVYPLASDQLLLVVNAANTSKDLEHILQAAFAWQSGPGQDSSAVQVIDQSSAYAQISLQGPAAARMITSLEGEAAWTGQLGLPPPSQITALHPYHFIRQEELNGSAADGALISRTGYTGEDGFEIYLEPAKAASLWRLLIDRGAVPAGLGARDSLRLEAAMPLYGHELSPEISPLDAGLDRFVAMDKPWPGFIGQSALQQLTGIAMPRRRLIGLKSLGRSVPRADYPVLVDARQVGWVTSGIFSPSLGQGIAMALVDSQMLPAEDQWRILIRGREEPFALCQLPFYRRGR
jgi:aminomethyltransferase